VLYILESGILIMNDMEGELKHGAMVQNTRAIEGIIKLTEKED